MNPKVRFSCMIPGVKDVYPIKPISHFRPHWLDAETQEYVAARKEYQNNDPWGIVKNGMTIAKCTGIRKLYTTGWVLTTWQDILIHNDPQTGKLDWKTPIDQTIKCTNIGPSVGFHNPQTFKHCPHLAQFPHILKFENPWLARLPKGYSMLQMPFPYQEHDMFQAVVGIFPEELGHMQLNVQLLWKAKGTTLIPAGTPLSHLVLIKNEDYEYEVGDVTPAESYAWDAQTVAMHNSWERNYTAMKDAISSIMDDLDAKS